jgi:osmoprotectant transport system substrate-binding protein
VFPQPRTFGAALLLLAVAVLATACGSSSSSDAPTTARVPAVQGSLPGDGKPKIVIGSKDFTEEFLLCELYAQALAAKGYAVEVKKNIGSSEVVDPALVAGEISMYPEYVGEIVTTIAHSKRVPRSAPENLRMAGEFERKRGFTLLDTTPFEDVDAIAATKAFARRHHLRTLSDLRGAGPLRLGARAEFRTRFTGLVGMRQLYGLTRLRYRVVPLGVTYRYLDERKIDLANVFSTDAALDSGRYTLLKDTKHLFGYQQVAPVISTKLLRQLGPEFPQIVNRVSALLTAPVIRRLNADVDLRKRKDADVAADFLAAHGLV